MKYYLFLIFSTVFCILSISTFAQDDLINKVKANQSAGAAERFTFTKIHDIEATDVKDQGSSGTCWSYSTISFLESEMMRMGKKPVDLAEMFIVRNQYIDKAETYVRMQGGISYGQGGAAHDVTALYGKYGILPQEVYQGLNYGTDRNNFNEMEAVLKGFLEAIVKVKKLSPVWKTAFTRIVDTYLGEVPTTFSFEGKEYTPTSFAKEVVGLNAADYVQFSSFTTSPFYEQAVLLIPDNWSFGSVYNLPMNDLVAIADHALANGYTMTWATDVSDRGFSWKNGIAYVLPKEYDKMSEQEKTDLFAGPKLEGKVNQEIRQEAFDNYTTTDDHLMQITGLYKDQNGREYYKVKNSWGERNDYNGYLYVTKNYLKMGTIGLLLHKDGVPMDIQKKCRI